MPVFFVLGIGSLLLLIFDLFIGEWRVSLVSFLFWLLAVRALGSGIDWDRRVMLTSAYSAMTAAAAFAVAGLWFRG